MVAVSKSSQLYGPQGQPHYITGAFYLPQGYGCVGGTITTTATRCYYFPLAVFEAHTFQGATTINQGAGDNGEKIRLMVFNDLAAGGPGTLAKDFGEIVLTGASAVRTLASAWAATPGIYWGAVWHETAAAMYGMEPHQFGSAVGALAGMVPSSYMGVFGPPATGATNTYCHYVDTTYGAAPASAVTPTGSLAGGQITAIASVTGPPVFFLKA